MKLEPAHLIFLKAALRRRPREYFSPGVTRIVLLLRLCLPFKKD